MAVPNSAFALRIAATTAPIAHPEEFLWSGSGSLVWRPPGDTADRAWKGSRLLSHSPYESGAAGQSKRLTVVIRLPDTAAREKWRQDYGPLEAHFYKLFDPRDGSGWTAVDYVRGLFSDARHSLFQHLLTVNIERALEAPGRRPPERMTMHNIGKPINPSWPP